ncbi:GIY-YIG nuclease family protein [Paraburkholderia sp. DGU8]|uniref:GIY-YIG nuclease family protein n=1 Tax=Paraburkholderia sp. DGU8 TaxID=3161997 RepID=UPI003465F34D
MIKPFEPSRSFCYHFARYQAIPEILVRQEVATGAPFRLIDVAKPVIDRHLTSDQQAMMVKKQQSDQTEPILKIIKFYVPFIAKNTGQLISLGGGFFRLPTAEDLNEDELEDAELEEAVAEGDTAEADTFDGTVYAFSFPALLKAGAPFPIKVGKATGDVDKRVAVQCKGSATFENPVILGRWPVQRVGAVESAIHKVLQSRGKWRENAPGTEWFDTTIEEIQSIVTFIGNLAQA